MALEAKIELILDKLKDSARVEFKDLLAPWQEKMHGVMTLLAGLELSKQRAVTLRQAQHFSDLWFLRRDLGAWSGELSDIPVRPGDVDNSMPGVQGTSDAVGISDAQGPSGVEGTTGIEPILDAESAAGIEPLSDAESAAGNEPILDAESTNEYEEEGA